MNPRLLSARTSARLARIRVEGWLSLHRPESIPDYVDRVFARTVQARDPYGDAELSSLLIDRRRFLDLLLGELRTGAICSHLVDALRLTWVFRRRGLPVHELEELVAPFVERFEPAADAWDEPERSDFFYWAKRLGWSRSASSFEIESRPLCDMAALLRQCDYGEQTIPRSQATLHTGLVRAVETDPSATAMLLAGMLWVETALDPASPMMCERIANRLIEL